MRYPSFWLTTERITSGSARLMLNVLIGAFLATSSTRARPSIHSRCGSNVASMS